MAKMPLVSVLMPFYDSGNAEIRRYFREALGSILAQTFRDFEVVLIVSGKKDFAEKEAAKSGKIRLFQFRQESIEKNRPAGERLRGIITARNLCLRHARGKFIAWADADDVSLPRRLSVQYNFLKSHPEIGLVGSSMIVIADNGGTMGCLGTFEEDEKIRQNLIRFPTVYQPAVFTYRLLVRKAGGYGNELSEDYDLWARMARITRMHNIQEPLVKYRMHQGGSSQYRLQHFFSSLSVKWKIMRTLGIYPRPSGILLDALYLVSYFYPTFLGRRLFVKLRTFVFSALCPELNGIVGTCAGVVPSHKAKRGKPTGKSL